jgi:predicted nucleic-acid-binding protein
MIGLDTNVLARLFVDDDAEQARKARQYVAAHCDEENPAFVDRIALCELVWVLARGHDYRRNEIAAVIEKLLDTPEILLEDEKAVRLALRTFSAHNIDFADVLICETNRLRGCDTTATFDRKAGKLDGFSLVA